MFLKQSTAYTFRMGPFVDDTDGKTAETGLTIEDSHIRVSKAGANFIDKNETTNAAHDEAGFYVVILDTTDTNTVGELQIAIHVSGALPVFKTFQVVEEDIYAAFFAGSATLAASVASILADTAELQGDWVNGGRLDLLLDATLADTAELQGDWVNGGRLDLLLDAVLADTAELQGDWANGGRLDLIVDAILVDTGTTLDGKLNNLWTTDIVEAYAGPSETACTPAQMLYMILSCVGSYKIESDKIITLKLDESTQAMRFDMDSTSSPTYRKRDA